MTKHLIQVDSRGERGYLTMSVNARGSVLYGLSVTREGATTFDSAAELAEVLADAAECFDRVRAVEL